MTDSLSNTEELMNKTNILIIGCGQLGSRHLQACLVSQYSLNISIVEPSLSSAELARQRMREINIGNSLSEVNFFYSLLELKDLRFDITIIATNSDIRIQILNNLSTEIKTRFLILEKVVFQSNAHFKEASSYIEDLGCKTFMNCPRRIDPMFKEIKEKLGANPFQLDITGKNWDLACNAIHFIDLFFYCKIRRIHIHFRAIYELKMSIRIIPSN